jgi:sigma-E factor negative regulatory protein RseC
MMTTTGRVINVAGPLVQVRIEAASACSSCGTKGSCAGGQSRAVWVEAPEGVKSGDLLKISIPERAFNTAALIGYLLPAVTTLVGAALLAPSGDTTAVMGALSGLGLGLVLVRLLGRWRVATTDFCSTERSTFTGDLT